jgi:UPF0716 protein FxsA
MAYIIGNARAKGFSEMLLRVTVGLIFIIVPVLELMLLIRIGQGIGALATVALVLSTALTGAYIISRQSLTVVTRTLEAASQGRPPVGPVLDALFLLVAGALLVTPGLLTDVVALALLIPPVRRAVARVCVRWLMRRADVRIRTYTGGGPREGPERPPPSAAAMGDGPVIEGEFERVDERPAPPRTGPRRSGGRPT